MVRVIAAAASKEQQLGGDGEFDGGAGFLHTTWLRVSSG